MLGLMVQIGTLALGVAASPLPVVAVLVMLLTKRARFSSIVALISWELGVVGMLAISVLFAGRLRLPTGGSDLAWEGIFTLLLGVGLVVMGVLSRRGRFMQADPEEPPSWVRSVDNLSPMGGALVVFLNATTSPKNLALAITAGRVLARPDLPLRQSVIAAVVYVAIASLTLAIPVALYIFGGDKAVGILEAWKLKVTSHAAAVMEITLFGLGIGMAAKGLFNLLF